MMGLVTCTMNSTVQILDFGGHSVNRYASYVIFFTNQLESTFLEIAKDVPKIALLLTERFVMSLESLANTFL